MSLKPLLSFSSGELDPILTDLVTLEKFQKGLDTARNVFIGKTGSIFSRFSRYHLVNGKIAGKAIKIYCPPNSDYLLEFGDLYVRIHSLTTADDQSYVRLDMVKEIVLTFTEADLPFLHFVNSKDFVYVFCNGKEMLKILLNGGASALIDPTIMFAIPNVLGVPSVTQAGAPTGYKVDYLVSLTINGQESLYQATVSTTGYTKPIAAGQSNVIVANWNDTDVDINQVSEMRVYSRPNNGGAYGFLGSTSKFTVPSAGTHAASYEDVGSLPDYENGIQDSITKFGLAGQSIIGLHPKTGAVYQQRLIITSFTDKEALIASRPGFQNNFYRDFPYAADSALQFKAGTSGKANVLRIIESDGLVVFTTNGVYINTGLLSVDNTGMERKGGWIIDERLPPLVVPGGLFFVDQNNTIRQLIFSQEILAYESVEQTIFSNHLFAERTIDSWAFQDGLAPLIIVTFSDGTFATFTYNYEQQMKAWTRHDSAYPLEQVEGTGRVDRSFFVTNKNGNRSIEVTLPRKIKPNVIVANPEADMSSPTAFMDAIHTDFSLLNALFTGTQHFTIAPVVVGDWEGNLTVTSPVNMGFTSYDVGYIFRFFDPKTKNAIDLTIASVTSDFIIVVTPSEEFPSTSALTARIYGTNDTVSGLDHLEGESVSVMVDGSLVASPLNDKEDYAEVIVEFGLITLPDDMRGAIIHVGRPICADIKTLNISTVEQSPTLIESLNVNKLYVRVNQTRGLYIANKFPEEILDEKDGSSVEKMDSIDEALIPEVADLIGNKFFPPVSKRCEITIPGDWDNMGRVAIRQVDPYHFEILSIIPDITILARSDR